MSADSRGLPECVRLGLGGRKASRRSCTLSIPSSVSESTAEIVTHAESGVREIPLDSAPCNQTCAPAVRWSAADRYVRPRWYVTASALALVVCLCVAAVAAAAGFYAVFWDALVMSGCAGAVLVAADEIGVAS